MQKTKNKNKNKKNKKEYSSHGKWKFGNKNKNKIGYNKKRIPATNPCSFLQPISMAHHHLQLPHRDRSSIMTLPSFSLPLSLSLSVSAGMIPKPTKDDQLERVVAVVACANHDTPPRIVSLSGLFLARYSSLTVQVLSIYPFGKISSGNSTGECRTRGR